MNKSETIAKLAEALSRAQAEMPAAKFNSVNPFLKNKYADLGSIIDTAKPVLGKFGLAVTQLPINDGEGRVGVETVLTHASGEWISTQFSLPLADEKGKSGAQVAGSIITYLRRYSLAAILGMYSDEDTDGNEVKQELKPREAKPAEKPVESETMTIEDACRTTTSQNKQYGEMTIVGLEKMLSAMHTKLSKNELSPEEKAEVERKIKAAQMVLAAKENGEIN